jgi:rubrerythrin
MTVMRRLLTLWKNTMAIPPMDNRAKLLEILQIEYCDEVKDVLQITHHAQYMYYPHFREKLLRIAAEEEAHVRWFAEKSPFPDATTLFDNVYCELESQQEREFARRGRLS